MITGRVVAAVLMTGVAALMPSTASAATKAPGPDLIIAKITVTELPGNPPYAEVDHNDNAKTFVVKVVTQNIGTVKVGKTETFFKLEENLEGPIYRNSITVGPLTPGMYRTSNFKVEDIKPHLGILIPVARADILDKVREGPPGGRASAIMSRRRNRSSSWPSGGTCSSSRP